MTKLLSTSAVALATIFLSTASAADLGRNTSDPTSVASEQPFSWTGGFIGGQFGYGIASQRVTEISTENFAAVPSRCWTEKTLSLVGETWVSFDEDLDVAEEDCKVGTSNGSIPYVGKYSKTIGFDAAQDEDTETTKTSSKIDDSGITGGIQAGFDKQLGRIVVGVFGDVNWSAIDGKDFDWTVGARAGFLIDPRVLVYVLGGYTQAEFDEATYDGWTVGGGLEYAVTRNIFLGGKYTYTDYGSETLVDTPALKIDSERDEHRILADIKFKLNGDFGF